MTATVRTRTYEDKEGKRRKVTEFQAEEIEFCDSKAQGTPIGGQRDTQSEAPEEFVPINDDKDCPF